MTATDLSSVPLPSLILNASPNLNPTRTGKERRSDQAALAGRTY